MSGVLVDSFLPVAVLGGAALVQVLLCLVQIAARKRWDITGLLWALAGLAVVGGLIAAHIVEANVYGVVAVASGDAKQQLLAQGMLGVGRITSAALLLGAVQLMMAGAAHSARRTAGMKAGVCRL